MKKTTTANEDARDASLRQALGFGHDVVDEVRIDDGRVFRVRGPQSTGAIGDRLGVRLQARRLRVFAGSHRSNYG